jgi:hypothetical protein
MPVKRAASRRASRDDPSSGDSSSQDDDFVIAPRPKKETRKSTPRSEASSSQANEEAANKAESRAVHETREARESELIQKVEHPLWSNFENTLRRVDHHHPRMPTDFTRGENESMIHRDEYRYDWTQEYFIG